MVGVRTGDKGQGNRRAAESRFCCQPSLLSHLATYLLEIGTEELPGHDLVDALNQLKVAVPKLLADLRLAL